MKVVFAQIKVVFTPCNKALTNFVIDYYSIYLSALYTSSSYYVLKFLKLVLHVYCKDFKRKM